jgi:hypothetical protein
MSMLVVKARTALALGVSNLVRFLGYRVGVRIGTNPIRSIRASIPPGEFFSSVLSLNVAKRTVSPAWVDNHSYFGWHQVISTSVPNWYENPFVGKAVNQPMRPWWLIPDFDATIGDIKTVWEASRFDWVIIFAQHAINGDPKAMARLNGWLADWVRCNPPYYGPNWKCGQEASIRVMHLAIAALLLGQHHQTLIPLQALIKAHLQRIAPTIQYAISQDNNHGTSEAAALFIGGSWLAALGDSAGDKWQKIGRKWLENRATRLIEEDGSFSQYSITYHRVMLDTYCMAEHWRRRFDLPPFSQSLYRQLAAAAYWLYQMTQTETGDAPNLGANDGARLLPLTDTDYRDFRPSVQLSMALFCQRYAYAGDGSWNLPLDWLGIAVPLEAAVPVCCAQLAQGGYSILRRGKYFALLRFPRFRFRPSQADALHVDLWFAGKNLLRDAGTYSYNAGDEVTRYFAGTAGHNTVQFDERDQMPRLSRFLFGDWLKTKAVVSIEEGADTVRAAAGYIDDKGAAHYRELSLSDQGLRVEDTVSGFKQKAVLRWRLLPADWRLDGNTVRLGGHTLRVTASVPIVRMTLTQGWESRYYLKKESVPVLEVEIHQPGHLVTEYQFQP